MSSIRYGYKVLNEDGSAFHGGKGKWLLPEGSKPGPWMPSIPPKLCSTGYHFCRDITDLLLWLGPVIYKVEVAGIIIDGHDKAVASTARLIKRLNWGERTARLFAADCAERAVNAAILEKDIKPFIAAISAARKYANGDICELELSAAWSAAWSAARSAADSAAWSAADSAAWSSARSAAWYAAWSAANSAARSAADSAAWSAARSAAWSAADSAAWSSARSAADSAAWSSARSAASSVERKKQAKYLRKLLEE